MSICTIISFKPSGIRAHILYTRNDPANSPIQRCYPLARIQHSIRMCGSCKTIPLVLALVYAILTWAHNSVIFSIRRMGVQISRKLVAFSRSVGSDTITFEDLHGILTWSQLSHPTSLQLARKLHCLLSRSVVGSTTSRIYSKKQTIRTREFSVRLILWAAEARCWRQLTSDTYKDVE